MKCPHFPWILCAALLLPACFGEKESTAAAGVTLTAAGAPAGDAACSGDHDAAGGCAMEAGCSMEADCPSKQAAAAPEHDHAGAGAEAGCSGEEVCASQVLAMAAQADVVVAAGRAAAPPAAPAEETAYGAALTLTTATPISSLLAGWDAYEGKTVQVRGTVVAVCEHRGCWMDIAGTEDFQKIRFKVNDGEMVFPITDKGCVATAEGVVQKLVIPVEQLREAYAA
nr:DUF4920 domain-containing protein [Planctomycetota bacterium]